MRDILKLNYIFLQSVLKVKKSMYLITIALVKTAIFHNYDLRLKLLQRIRKKIKGE